MEIQRHNDGRADGGMIDLPTRHADEARRSARRGDGAKSAVAGRGESGTRRHMKDAPCAGAPTPLAAH